MFKFDFSKNNPDDNDISKPNETPPVEWLESEEIKPELNLNNIMENRSLNFDSLTIKFCNPLEVIEKLKDNDSTCSKPLLNAEQNHSDLVTGIYEGGLKIWECTYDLINYFTQQNIDFVDRNVLDLGCGAGILGIIALLKGAHVTFQDYNSEVLRSTTIPNVKLNTGTHEKTEYFSGDWESFVKLKQSSLLNEQDKYDIILTSETIYNPNNYAKLLQVFEKLLKKSGDIYLAAKSHYFGVGGGIGQFQEALDNYNIFTYTKCWECLDGVRRIIIKINFKTYYGANRS